MNLFSLDGAQAKLMVDLSALKANWRLLSERSAPAECGAVVKADAYGVGIEQAVPTLSRAGCRTFFVAHLSEGVRARKALRKANFAEPAIRIFLLHGLQPGAVIHPDCFGYRLGPVLGSRPEIDAWVSATTNDSDRPPCAIHVDTGMNRTGLEPGAIQDLPADIAGRAGAVLLMSHFVSAEEPANPSNAAQITAFEEARRSVFHGLAASLANSSGIFLHGRPHYDLTRPGYALYGGNPCPGRPNPMQAVVALQAAILQTRMIGPGETVGYNGRWVASRPTRLATIGIGYADGIPRGADTLGSGRGPQAAIGGLCCPLVGRISMDLSVIDVTDVPPDVATPGSPVELLGPRIGVDDFARACGTIGYEILTGLGRRYSRIYLDTVG